MQTCLGFFLKSLLECPGNLEICSVTFVDSRHQVTGVDIPGKLASTARYDKQQICVYLTLERLIEVK